MLFHLGLLRRRLLAQLLVCYSSQPEPSAFEFERKTVDQRDLCTPLHTQAEQSSEAVVSQCPSLLIDRAGRGAHGATERKSGRAHVQRCVPNELGLVTMHAPGLDVVKVDACRRALIGHWVDASDLPARTAPHSPASFASWPC